MMCWIVQFAFVVVVTALSLVSAERCIPGDYHKNNSSPASEEYKTCTAWSKDTCCTANYTKELHANQVKNFYNFDWGHCKNLSKECEKYILAEECFYYCEPRLIGWHTGVKYYLKGIPVCSDFCNNWYKACENDETCGENWLTDFNYTSVKQDCLPEAKCRTFKQIYGSGKNLCNKMWGDTFVYAEKDKCPCTNLDGPIPANVTPSSTCSGQRQLAAHSFFSAAMFLLVLKTMCYV